MDVGVLLGGSVAVRVGATVSVSAAGMALGGLDAVCAGSDKLQATAASANTMITEKDVPVLYFTVREKSGYRVTTTTT